MAESQTLITAAVLVITPVTCCTNTHAHPPQQPCPTPHTSHSSAHAPCMDIYMIYMICTHVCVCCSPTCGRCCPQATTCATEPSDTTTAAVPASGVTEHPYEMPAVLLTLYAGLVRVRGNSPHALHKACQQVPSAAIKHEP